MSTFRIIKLQQWAHMTSLAVFLWEKQLAHPQPSVEFLSSTNEPICNFWQHVSGTTLGPYDTIGSISISEKVGPSATIGRILWQHQWANSQLLAACPWKNIGPIQDHQQNLLAAPADPFTAFGSMSLEQHWAHMTPSTVFLWWGQLAHPQLLAEFFSSTNGPIHTFWQC